jgi:hypothetical protein
MKAMMVITVSGLYKDGRVGQALGIDFTANIIQMHTLANVSSRILNGTISVNITQLAQTKAIRIVARICESIDND